MLEVLQTLIKELRHYRNITPTGNNPAFKAHYETIAKLEKQIVEEALETDFDHSCNNCDENEETMREMESAVQNAIELLDDGKSEEALTALQNVM